MFRTSTRIAVGLGILVGAALALTYSWTFTRYGRLDYKAAVISRVASWQDQEDLVMTPSARASANAYTMSLLPEYPVEAGVRFEDRLIGTPDGAEIPIRIYTPPGEGPHPFYLDIHGGGWWMGGGFSFHRQSLSFAGLTDAIVVAVDYRLAPEYPYPTPLDDCATALHWIAENGASVGGDPSRIAIGGGSAGGNLAAALALRMRNSGGPRIAFQYLNVPATDLSGTRDWESYDESGDQYVLTVSGIQSMIEAYVPEAQERMEPYVSPLLEGNLGGLPPTFVVTAQFDPLRDQGEAFAGRLREAGVPVVVHREMGAIHGFLGSPARALKIQVMAARAVRAALYR